jgi:hypothetical protein
MRFRRPQRPAIDLFMLFFPTDRSVPPLGTCALCSYDSMTSHVLLHLPELDYSESTEKVIMRDSLIRPPLSARVERLERPSPGSFFAFQSLSSCRLCRLSSYSCSSPVRNLPAMEGRRWEGRQEDRRRSTGKGADAGRAGGGEGLGSEKQRDGPEELRPRMVLQCQLSAA